MKRLRATVAVVTAMIAGAAYTGALGTNWLPRERVVHLLKQKSYNVTKLEAGDGHWEG